MNKARTHSSGEVGRKSGRKWVQHSLTGNWVQELRHVMDDDETSRNTRTVGLPQIQGRRLMQGCGVVDAPAPHGRLNVEAELCKISV